MEVSNNNAVINEYNYDIDRLKKRLRDSEEDHQEEIKRIRENQREADLEIAAEQSENIERANRKAEEFARREKEIARNEVSELADRYDRQFQSEKSKNYDRYGNLVREKGIEEHQQKRIAGQQMDDILKSQKRDIVAERMQREKEMNDFRDFMFGQNEKLQEFYGNKLVDMKEAHSEDLALAARSARESRDKNLMEAREEVHRDRIGGDLRLKNYITEKEAETESKTSATNIREQQLVQKAADAETGANSAAMRAYEESKNKANAQLELLASNHNREAARKTLENSKYINQLRNEEAAKHELYEGMHNSRERDLVNKVRSNKVNHEDDLARAQRKHRDDFLTSQQISKRTNDESMNQMKETYEAASKNQKSKADNAIDTLHNDSTMKMKRDQQAFSDDTKRLKDGFRDEIADTNLKHDRFVDNLTRSSHEKYESLDEMRRRQLDGQESHLRNVTANVRKGAEKSVQDINRESTLKQYTLREDMRRLNDELTRNNDSNLTTAERNYNKRADKLTRMYRDNLTYENERHQEAFNELSSENRARSVKLRSDHLHEMQMKMHELQNRNREMQETYEDKLVHAKEESAVEIKRMKEETDKALRDNNKRTKELIERERTQNERQLQAKDMQLEEKLKLQANTFNDQIEKLKRTNVNTIKKG